jgi:hypothetical protein
MDVVLQAGPQAGEGSSARGAKKALRSETTSIRFDPKLKYLAELAARKQRRSLSSFIEFAVERTLGEVNFSEGSDNEAPTSIESVGDQLWDVDEPDRFVKLAFRYPEILTYAEQILWKLIREMPGLWAGKYDERNEWTWKTNKESLAFEAVREHWATLKKVARSEMERTKLPAWLRDKRKSAESGG